MANGRAATAGTTALTPTAEPSHSPLARAARWARQHLFSSWLSTAVTLALAYVLFKTLAAVLSWGFFNAIWTLPTAANGLPDTRICREVRADSACWALITERYRFILFGTYPYVEQWRGAVVIALFLALYGLSAMRQFWNAALAYIWGIGLFLIAVMMWGIDFEINGSGRSAVLLGVGVALVVVARWAGAHLPTWIRVVATIAGWLLVLGWGPSALIWLHGDYTVHVSVPFLPFVEQERWGGLPLTLILATFGIALAFPLSILVALGRRSSMPAIRIICVAYVELIRGVPLISVLFMASVMFPLFLPEGVTIDKLLRAQVAIILFAAAYLAEVVRGGLQAIPKGQYEAADALGLGYWQKTGLIILPQALRICIPPLVGTFIGLFKDTSLVTIIGLYDLLGAAKASIVEPHWVGFGVEAYLFISLIYFVFCFAMSKYSQNLEGELSKHTKR